MNGALVPADPLRAALFLVAALSLAGLAHSAWLGSARSRRWMIPLDGGLTYRGRRVFGENKTMRGLMMMVPASAAAFVLVALALGETSPGGGDGTLWRLSLVEYATLGAVAGLGLMLGELPNSFVKRQLDIAPGEAPRSAPARALSFLVDRLDSIVGMLIAVSATVPTPWSVWVWVIVLGPAIHWSFSVLLYRLGVKPRAA